MTVELIYTIRVTFIYSVFGDILKTNKNQTDDTVQFQDNIRPEEESQETQKTD